MAKGSMTIHLTQGRVSRVATNVSELASLDIAVVDDERPMMLVRPQIEHAIVRYVEGARRQTQWARLNTALEYAGNRFLQLRNTCQGDPEALLARIADVQTDVFSLCRAAMSPDGAPAIPQDGETKAITFPSRRA